jgi:hypothetical protein
MKYIVLTWQDPTQIATDLNNQDADGYEPILLTYDAKQDQVVAVLRQKGA